MFTKEAQALAKATVEAIKKIAEKAGDKCPKCKGEGEIDIGMRWAIEKPVCPKCNGTGKVKGKWEWEPEVGEWCIERDKCYLIVDVRENKHPGEIWINTPDIYATTLARIDKLIPLLHWERVEEVLEGMGYYLYFCNKRQPKDNVYAEIRQGNMFNKMIVIGQGKSRQEAVQMAVIELGKEQANEKD